MYSSRRLPVYVLHDGSAAAVRGIAHLLDRLRCDPQALEIAWLSFISLAGEAKQVVPLTELCCIGFPGVREPQAGSPDLAGGLRIFESDANANLVKPTSSSKGDWRPLLVLYLASDPGSELSAGLDVIKERRCVRRQAFIGEAVTSPSRTRLMEAGFELVDVADGMTVPKSDSDVALSWDEALAKAISIFPYGFYPAPPWVARDAEQPQAALPDDDAKPESGGVVFSSATSSRGEVDARPQVNELKPGNLFTVDLGNLSTDGRLTRRGLFGYYVLNFVLMVIAAFISILSAGLAFGLLTIGFWIFLIGLIKRAHDVGLSGWFVLVPFLNLWLLFAPGQKGANKFGPDPRAAD